MTKKQRLLKGVLSVILSGCLALMGCVPSSGEQGNADTIRIGYQKFGPLSVMKARGTLEKQLEPHGIKVEWTHFTAGPQLMEALHAGSIDIGQGGDTPPIYAQAAGTPFVYIGAGEPRPESEAILVPKDSPIRSVKDLKGKRVALNKGSNVHYFLVSALEKEGLSYQDIHPVYLKPGEARPAFAKKSVDAWAIWDPYYAAAEIDLGARKIADGKGYSSNREFFFAQKDYAAQNKEILQILLKELKITAQWYNRHPDQTATLLSKQIDMDIQPVTKAIRRVKHHVGPMDLSIVQEQQRIADTFTRHKLIPGKIQVKEAIWQTSEPKGRIAK
ncbi:sulfonate ABC transporter substrate-binding protein [Kroppenstedtia pulmonis]|uniref:Putative aliphatic sulfonates-binding protein n=1 Tax=Kroppenstedtia pulmonis TaxID=1380685 RepID=A0A7D4CJM8_9BACL|nr:sulfonate ABC transporter substrate-binding protein [Kroppenstedtia pulmonis]QKG83118.1 sulfonate ABC transporter substrate-binding protein [Kroppenstedtia pulmonis]